MAQESRSTLLVSCPETVTLHRAMSCVTPHLTTPSTGAPSLSPTLSSSHVLHPPLSEHKSCGDLRPHLSGALAEPRPFTFEGIIGKQVSDGLSDQTRLSILSWNVGPRRGKTAWWAPFTLIPLEETESHFQEIAKKCCATIPHQPGCRSAHPVPQKFF